jgi:hypothetical protein
MAEAERENIGEVTKQQQAAQRQAIEGRLRRENGPRARALRDKIDKPVKDDAMKRLNDIPPRASETIKDFPLFASWLNRRFDDQWESTDVQSEVEDYGTVQWNGRTLEGIVIRTTIRQRNRIKGAYESSCFIFAEVDDEEFTIFRDKLGVECDKEKNALDTWKIGIGFRSQWNAEGFQRTQLDPQQIKGSESSPQ